MGRDYFMSVHRRLSLSIAAIAAGLVLVSPICAASDAAAQADFFRERVAPVLIRRCLQCHGDSRKGELDLRSRETALAGGEHGAVIVPGEPNKSPMIKRVFFEEMPPKDPLSDDESEILEQWIADGAYFPDEALDPLSITTERRAGYDWWSLRALREVEIPSIDSALKSGALPASWQHSPIDRFVGATLHSKGLAPSVQSDPRTLMRRATYDLTGLSPTPEEAAAFVAECASESGDPSRVGDQAYARLLDRLLASPRYGERWGRHWLDVIRFGESSGFEVNYLLDDAWPYRDYVIQSLNEDKPFHRMVMEQLAGDSVAPGDPAVEVGLTFLACGPVDIVGNQDPVQAAQIRANGIDDMVRTTAETFLGLTVGCARCHDHKFDPISQKDYYRLYSTFAGVHQESREVATEEQRTARRRALEPLEARRTALFKENSEISDAILARAEGRVPAYADAWKRPAVARSGTEELFDPVQAKYLRLVVSGRDSNPSASSGFKIDEFEAWTTGDAAKNVALSANGGHAEGKSPVAEDFGQAYLAELTIDGKFGQSWIAQEPTLTISFANVERIGRVHFSSDRAGALAPGSSEAPFPCEYRIETSIDGKDWVRVADSADRSPVNDAHRRKRLMDLETSSDEAARLADIGDRQAAVETEIASVPRLPVLRVGQLRQPEGAAHVFKGGDPQRVGDEVAPQNLDVLSKSAPTYRLAPDAPERERRLELAQWITSAQNPLPARVLANRLWHYHFGTGIVSTPSDFGFMGSAPTHPELLEWLARELVQPGLDAGGGEAAPDQVWRLKRMHRLIMLSQTYRQAGTYRKEASDVDSESRLLWRFPPRRLSGEEIRDSMLAASGVLDARMGGPGFRLYRYIRDNVASYIPLDEYGPETYRRSVYHQNARASRIDLMTDFDAPDCALVAPRRSSTTTPLQALTLMNHRFTLDMAQALAARVTADAGDAGIDVQVTRAFELLFLRAPGAAELQQSAELARTQGLRALCRALFNSNEFIYLD